MSVRDDDAPTVIRLQKGGARLDVLDCSFVRAEDDLIADEERFGGEDEDAGEKVLEDVLEGETCRDPTDSKGTDGFAARRRQFTASICQTAAEQERLEVALDTLNVRRRRASDGPTWWVQSAARALGAKLPPPSPHD